MHRHEGPVHAVLRQQVRGGVPYDDLLPEKRITLWQAILHFDPHPGEMSRLTGLTVREIEADRLGVARQMAKKWRQVVILKGAYTVIADPEGGVVINPFANPGLATAGSGDVLAGAIVGFLAQGLAPDDAALVGAYVHGLAGELVRKELGGAGMVAGDLLPMLPKTIKLLYHRGG